MSRHSFYTQQRFPKNRAVCGILWKNTAELDRPHMTICSHVLHSGYIRLQTQIQNMKYVLLFHSNNGYTNAPQCHVSAHIASLVIYEYRMTMFVCRQLAVSLHTSCSVFEKEKRQLYHFKC
jgi:hypothetical protein